MFPREFGKIAAYLRKKLWLEWLRGRRFAGLATDGERAGSADYDERATVGCDWLVWTKCWPLL